ncbi:MAG: UvrD-helicase domain-containing protein, partial [Xanthomonadales bacterium]|nr:UvrD-helicase domain-containing protein [Xanthomonadales bacterium]
MSAPSELDWRTLPLSGTSLIEASAGTGKTYNIALLYLRLVLERGLDARQLLVTTFTDAAAQELRARIRQRLLDAEAALATPELPDSDLKAFLEELCARGGRTPVLTRVKLALSEIDLAPISTIHGFCKRVLSDFPFDTGVPFTLGEIVDEKALIRECVEDFWRKRFLVDAIDLWDSASILDGGLEPFAKIVGDVLSVDADAVDIERTEALRAWWVEYCQQDLSELRAGLEIDDAFNDAKRSALRKALRSLVASAQTGDPDEVEWEVLANQLDPDTVSRRGAKRYQPHLSTWPGITALSEVRHLFANAKGRVRNEAALDCAGFVREQLRNRLQVRGQTTFRQLIDEVHDRLLGSSGAQLATRLQQAWPVALIDE